MSNAGPSRLFGVPHAETLYTSVADAYECQVEPWADDHDRRPRIIEEWTVCEPISHLPSAASIAEQVFENACDDAPDGYFDAGAHVWREDDVQAAAEALRQAIAGHITYRVADTRVAEHQITWDEQGEPLVDGEPMYVPARQAPKGSQSRADKIAERVDPEHVDQWLTQDEKGSK